MNNIVLDEKIGSFDETNNPIKHEIIIPDDLIKENREFIIIRIHNGKVEELKTTLNGNILSFESDKYSTYLLAYFDKEEVTNPKTSDNVTLYLTIGTISLLGLGILIIKKQSIN